MGLPPPCPWLGEPGTDTFTVPPVENDKSLPVTNSKVTGDQTLDPKSEDVEIVEYEVINLSLESGVEQLTGKGPISKKRKSRQDGSEEVKKADKREAVDPISSQSLDLNQFQIIGSDSQPAGYINPEDELRWAVASIQ